MEPERLLLDQIATGELDAHPTAIFDAVRARRELLHTRVRFYDDVSAQHESITPEVCPPRER